MLRPKQATSSVSAASEHRGMLLVVAQFEHWFQQHLKTFHLSNRVTAERSVVRKWTDSF